ncbi:DMT family transporter [Paragemmobacter straminiformis]|uniref:DMT family transporter n=1 Tax=Paragemmobacter straminiformis TaxID=2045119 RepID=A0A842IGB4_9RHOB|nr:DMT family transporter [Gemmobacter straminiformis]MBC2837538.1 DMT family transporter [Gemmobacter straminiformis]
MSQNATTQNTRLGVWLMIATTIVFAAQDGISRHLGALYPVQMVVMIRFWFFAAFVMVLAARQPGGIRAATHTHFPLAQAIRGLLLVLEVCILVVAFVKLGLVESHAVFTCYPLLVAALSGPILGEKVGWRRWSAIMVGFVGVLIILQPGVAVFSPWALLPLLSSLLFAIYGLLTRYVARKDSASVSYFWTGFGGAAWMTLVGIWFWVPMAASDWIWMGALCCTASLGHWLLIRAFAVAEASAIQPFAYLQLVWISGIGLLLFGETLRTNVVIGAALVVAAGLFTLWRQWVKAQQARRPAQ